MITKFAKVPIEALADSRLTPTAFRVLVGILSFADGKTQVATVYRATLAERCGLPLSQITRTTALLVDLGWLVKSGNGGRNRAATYKVELPFSCANSAQVNGLNLRQIRHETCAKSAQRI